MAKTYKSSTNCFQAMFFCLKWKNLQSCFEDILKVVIISKNFTILTRRAISVMHTKLIEHTTIRNYKKTRLTIKHFVSIELLSKFFKQSALQNYEFENQLLKNSSMISSRVQPI